METLFLSDSPAFTRVILPLLIFYAPILGFFEVVIWLLAIGQIMQHL